MTARSSRSVRRKLGIVVALATALSLPGIGHAGDNNTCFGENTSDPTNQNPNACPEFTPGYTLGVRYPFRDTRADVNLEMSQARTESNALQWEWYLPESWRFNTSIRPAASATCTGAFNADGSVNQAEPVGDGLSMIGTVGGAVKYWGRARYDSSNSSRRNASHQFIYLNTSGTRTTMCALLQIFSTSTNIGGSANADKVIFPVYLDSGDFGDGYGWKVTVPVDSIHQQMKVNEPSGDFSLMSLDLEVSGLTGGLWHLENGIPARTNFSRTPRNPEQVKIGTRAFVCRSGGPNASSRYTMATCPAGDLMAYPYEGLKEFPFSVMLPPAYSPVGWAQITKAGDTTLPGAGTYYAKPVKGFGYTQGSNLLQVNWNVLPAGQLPPGVTATGYVLAVHKVTLHQSPETADEIAAGRILFERDFSNAPASRSISFNLMDMAENQQLGTVDGKYNISLVTVYNTPYGNGYRSDGRCDGASLNPPVADNGLGVMCPADRPLWQASGAGRDNGTSLMQVLVRSKDWPRRYLYSSGGQPLGVLLLDIPNKMGQYTLWGAVSIARQAGQVPAPEIYSLGQGIADQGADAPYTASSDLMYEPTGPASGIVRFGNFDLENEGFTWQVVAAIEGPTPSQASGPIPDARGTFHLYNARGGDADWLLNTLSRPMPMPGSDPTTYPNEFINNITKPSGVPQIILGDLNATAF